MTEPELTAVIVSFWQERSPGSVHFDACDREMIAQQLAEYILASLPEKLVPTNPRGVIADAQ